LDKHSFDDLRQESTNAWIAKGLLDELFTKSILCMEAKCVNLP
jgi:hypothetical protein